MISKFFYSILLISLFIYKYSMAGYVDKQEDYSPAASDVRETIAYLYAYSQNSISIWQKFKTKCLGDKLNTQYTGKEFYEKKLPEINKELKACYRKRFKEELTQDIVNKYSEDAMGGPLVSSLVNLLGYSAAGLPRSYDELLSCHDFTRSTAINQQKIFETLGYPQKGWCEKL